MGAKTKYPTYMLCLLSVFLLATPISFGTPEDTKEKERQN